ncbi:unnamed protein product [Penicillium salamii]|uniref:S-adenosyl-L-methionine-dependent methyltransferase n=1 Tax=Penicillium salamii TaxID=1612424 RepID=A0A9W4NAN4_9EURO|nr:unnamed protein product [Penicillium salamii]CAG8041094.1 unnamed protein product [Penicillium salamii]CAG8342143.1 unnamed protein product [Penicillium salamii]CAG8342531.1 unnamed protein product [Penicillium salamii]CAG8342734.1 unnamed protein product [Penicillium salamii]
MRTLVALTKFHRFDDATYTMSITSTALNYRYENGRRYHSYHEGEYVLTHHIYNLLLKGELTLAPVTKPHRVLDLGTGTGIWAMDYAEVPPNCRFEVDDFEQAWSHQQPFDLIHGRELEGCIRDHGRFFAQTLDNLNPNGWLEMATFETKTYSDDDTHLKATNFLYAIKNIHESSKLFGKDMASSSTWKSRMESAGFVNVTEEVYLLPQSPWPKDPKLKELGRYHQLNMIEAISPYTYALFTRMLRWSRVEIEALLAGIRKELRNTSYHLYTKVRVVYGQKSG